MWQGPRCLVLLPDCGPRAARFQGSFDSSSLETTRWFNCRAGPESDAHLSRLGASSAGAALCAGAVCVPVRKPEPSPGV